MAGSEQEATRVTAEHRISNQNLPPTSLISSKNAAEEISRPGKRPRLDPPFLMTAAAALADGEQRAQSPSALNSSSNSNQVSPNPQAQALGALMGVSQNAMSKAYVPSEKKAQDPTKTISEGVAIALETMQAQNGGNSASSAEENTQTSPISASSFDTRDSIAAPSGIGTTVASPTPLEATPQPAVSMVGVETASPDNNTNSIPFPAPLLQAQAGNDGRRGMSLPHSGLRQNTRSPSSRRHRCPYCSTEFTRHHNLKSHLLTHSQEKPYVCSTCQQRFRRLHDLKRHTKLHTGERPHVCPKCKRKFARGDALARHTKGPGGCAGRRASMGSFAGEDDYEGGDDSMEGVMYGEPEAMEDIEGDASKGTPSIRRQAPSQDDSVDDQDSYSRVSSTYPPLQGRPPGGIASGQFPPRSNFTSSPSLTSSAAASSGPPPPYASSGSTNSLRPQTGSHSGPSLYAQNPLTESPKPISPNQTQSRIPGPADARNQSPNVPQFQPPHTYSRPLSGPGAPHNGHGAGPQLPPVPGLNPPDSRYTLASQGGPTHPPTQPSGPPTHMSGSGPLSSHSNSLSSHGQSGHGSGENTSSMFNKDERIWAFVQDLERKIVAMQGDIDSLRSQLAVATAQQPSRL